MKIASCILLAEHIMNICLQNETALHDVMRRLSSTTATVLRGNVRAAKVTGNVVDLVETGQKKIFTPKRSGVKWHEPLKNLLNASRTHDTED